MGPDLPRSTGSRSGNSATATASLALSATTGPGFFGHARPIGRRFSGRPRFCQACRCIRPRARPGNRGLPPAQGSALAEAAHYIDTIGIDARDMLLVAPPMSHAYAYGMGVMVPLLSGASMACMRRFSPRLVHDACDRLDITLFPAVPMMLEMLMFSSRSLSRDLRCVLTAGSPLPERTARDFRRRYGVPVRPLYGTTETGGIAVAPADGVPLSGEVIGPAMRGVAVEVRSAASTAGLGNGIGILHVRSSSMMAGYVSENGLDESWVDGGWFSTGDLARIDAAGNIHLLGRQTDVINVGGLKVVPGEVEEVIALMPEVQSVAVYAGHRRSGAQFIKAAIVARPGLDVDNVRAALREALGVFQAAARVSVGRRVAQVGLGQDPS